MSKLVVTMSVTLDGVMQAPGRPDEDLRGGFDQGGWAVPYNDATMAQKMGQGMAQTGAMMFGRRTYEDLYESWAHRSDGNPFTEMMNNVQKYVASNTLTEPLPWVNSTLLVGDAADAVAELRKQSGLDIAVMGSGDLLRSLARRGLVDRYTLLIHPLLLGSGRRLFPEGAPTADLRLVDSVATTTGVMIATYEPA
jgi:dihydrofolate reductase